LVRGSSYSNQHVVSPTLTCPFVSLKCPFSPYFYYHSTTHLKSPSNQVGYMSESYSLWKKRGWYYCGVMMDGYQKVFVLETRSKKEAEKKVRFMYEVLHGRRLSDILAYYLNSDGSRSYNTELSINSTYWSIDAYKLIWSHI